MTRRWILSIGVVALALALWVAGCGGSSTTGTSSIQLFISDAPIDAKAVDITISRVEVAKDGDGWITLQTFDPELTLNLLDYRYDGDDSTPDKYLLADTPLEPGRYTQVRLILTKVELEDHDGNRYPVEMSSHEQTGLKIIGTFDVAPETKSAVLVDFDAGRSIVLQGTGDYRLKPTVRVVPLQITGSIKGTVEFKDDLGEEIPVPQGVTIAAYQGDTFVAASPIIDDGTFYIAALLAGDYDLVLEFPQGTEATHAIPDPTTASVTAGSETDVGTVTASPI